MNDSNNEPGSGRVYVKVWDLFVRVGHWTMVLCFASLYLRGDKFPLHAYAGYIIVVIMLLRFFWGFVGPHAVRFSTFIYSPKTMIDYGIQSVIGHPSHYLSHNPLASAMVFSLIGIMIGNGILGIMLYSSGQQLGILGEMVPAEWENRWFALNLFGQQTYIGLKDIHVLLGNIAALLVVTHMLGTLWAGAVHRSNHIVSLINGVKDTDANDPDVVHYEKVGVPRFARQLDDSVGPAMGQIILLSGIVACIIWPVIEILGWLNKFMPSY